jgi:uncharacterized protein (DUF2344 family)
MIYAIKLKAYIIFSLTFFISWISKRLEIKNIIKEIKTNSKKPKSMVSLIKPKLRSPISKCKNNESTESTFNMPKSLRSS